MRGARGRVATIALAVAALAGCRIGDTTYVLPGDGGTDGEVGDDGGVDAPGAVRVLSNPEETTVSEGSQVVLRVSLSGAPPSDATVSITSTDTGRISVNPDTLTFTDQNWNVERVVTALAMHDPDAADNPVTVILGGGGVVGDGSATITVTDTDLLALVVTPSSTLGVTEGQSADVEVHLTAEPGAPVAVSVSTTTMGEVTLSTNQLTFDASNWDQDQTVRVTGEDDADTSDDLTTLVLDPVPEGMASRTLMVTVTDDDILGIDASPGSLGTLTEGGASKTIAVRLTQDPGTTITVSVAASPSGSVTATPGSLMFDSGDWMNTKDVTVSAPPDVNWADESVSITLSSPGLANRVVTATTDDDDVQDVIVSPASIPNLVEGTAAVVLVHLAFQPAGNVVLDVSSLNPSVVNVNVSQLTFTPSNYDQDQQVRITGVEDPDLISNPGTVRLNLPSAGVTKDIAVTVTDNDTQAFVLDVTQLNLNEGSTGQIHVHLAYQPSSSVSVAVASDNPTKFTASPTTLSFSPSDYGTDRTVTVTALEDVDTANETGNVSFTATGIATRMVAISVADNDSADIVVSPTSLIVPEGQSRNLMVSLSAMPAATVNVTVGVNPPNVITPTPSTLSFSTTDWNMPKPVAVFGDQDADAIDDAATLSLTAPGLNTKLVPVTVDDDEVLSATVTPNPVTVPEYDYFGTYVYVRLTSDPGGPVDVTVAPTQPSLLDVYPTTLSFDQWNWDMDQEVTLTAVPDTNTQSESTTVTFTPAGGQTASLAVNIQDQTLILGWQAPYSGLPTSPGPNVLHGFRASANTLSSCLVIDTLEIQVASVPGTGFSQVHVGLYTDGATGQPGTLIYDFNPRAVVMGRNVYSIGEWVYSTGSPGTWISVSASTDVTLATKTSLVTHCSRNYSFGEYLPDPFGGSGTGSDGPISPDGDGGSDTDTGSAITCVPQVPFGVSITAHPDPMCL